MSQWRITLGPVVLLAARHTVMLVTGADKQDALRHVFHSELTRRKTIRRN